MNNTLHDSEQDQLRAIHTMLASGHASVHLERHTFLLWGLSAAFLILAVPELFSRERFTDPFELLVWQNSFISLVLIGTGYLDYRWTHQRRHARDESLSFVQRQVTKVWWMLIALVVVINIGMNLYGGGSLFYGITLVLIGIGIYVHGLFSRQMLTWGGGLMMLLGLALLATTPEIEQQEWIAASAFGIGLPSLSILVNRTSVTTGRRELFLSLFWLGLVLSPASIAISLSSQTNYTGWPEVSLEDYLMGGPPRDGEGLIVTLPAGTQMPLNIKLKGDTFIPADQAVLRMQLIRPLSIPVSTGEVENRLRIGQGRWKSGYAYRIRDWRVTSRLSPAKGPEMDLSLKLQFEN
ncbi:MAG: hypothetical protein ABFR65_09200 [Pseudomonadota bacterium]